MVDNFENEEYFTIPLFSTNASVKTDIFNQLKKVIAFRSIAHCDRQLFDYLKDHYQFSNHIDINEFRKEYWGIRGFRRFVIHFVKPMNTWNGTYAELNLAIRYHVLKNLYELLLYCTLKEQTEIQNKNNKI